MPVEHVLRHCPRCGGSFASPHRYRPVDGVRLRGRAGPLDKYDDIHRLCDVLTELVEEEA